MAIRHESAPEQQIHSLKIKDEKCHFVYRSGLTDEQARPEIRKKCDLDAPYTRRIAPEESTICNTGPEDPFDNPVAGISGIV